MIKPRERFGFAFETFGEENAAACVDRQDLERHQAVEFGLAGFVDDAHPAHAEQVDDLQLRELFRESCGIRGRAATADGWFAAEAHFGEAIRAKAFWRAYGHRFPALLA